MIRSRVNCLLGSLAVLALLALAVPGCQPRPTPATGQIGGSGERQELLPVTLSQGARLRVVATTNIVGDVVGRVGGERVELTTLMGVGVDPHSYVPTPAGMAAVHDAHVVFANGAGLEGFMEEMLESAGGESIQIYLSDGLELREAGHGHKGEGEEADPHVWFDVRNVIQWVEAIEQTLSALDPANEEAYVANAGTHVRELEELDGWIVEQIATVPEGNRKLVTNHPAFGYLAGRYGLEQVGAVYPISPSAEPSARDIAALHDTVREYGVPAVFAESTVNAKLVEQLAGDTGVKLVPLYSGSLGGPGSGIESYVALMRYDVTAIVEALK
jgi:manganese/iron transport system substrate-binding protein